jgi:hypothetical protein
MENQSHFRFYSGAKMSNASTDKVIADIRDFGFHDFASTGLNPTEVQVSDFSLEPHKILWHYWEGLLDQNGAAKYDKIDPIQFNKAMGYVLLMEPNNDNTDFRYRVYGSIVAERFGKEMTGKWVSEFSDGQKELSRIQYSWAISQRCPMYSEHIISIEEYTKTCWSRLILPMENSLGNLDRILVGNVPIDLPGIVS